jgi:hypothetical protein
MTPLIAEVNRWLTVQYAWGWNDCVTLCADWVCKIRGFDPAENFRGTYQTAGECQRVHRFFTDPVGAIAPHLSSVGIERTDNPKPGDVGIVLTPPDGGAARPHMALFVGSFWALKAQTGEVITFKPFKIIATWSVGYEAA